MKNQTQMLLKGSVMILSLTFMAGCDLFKKKEAETSAKMPSQATDSGATLGSINGEAVVSEADFLNNLQQMVQSNPYFRGATIESLPKELLRKFLDQLMTQALIEKYSVKNNIENDAEFIKAYNETEKLLKRSLMVQIFEKKIYDNLKVSDSDIKKHYAENKDRFVKVAGGVLAMGARFDSEKAADAFLAKVKTHLDDFEKLATADKSAKFRNFDRVTKESKGFQYEAVPAPVKETVLGMTKLPGVEKVKAGKDFWVVKAWDKQTTVLFELDEVKAHIESMLKNNLFKDALEARIKDLKKGFTIKVNEEYFKETLPQESEAEVAKEESVAAAA